MATSKARKLGKQRGFSLVSMMIGMAISLILLTTLLSLYQTTIAASQTSIARASLNASVESSLLTIQKEIQEVGFGSSSSMSSNLVLLRNAVLSGGSLTGSALHAPTGFGYNPSGNALVWSWVEPKTSTTMCQGILITPGGQLVSLDETSCSGASSSWSSLQWTTSNLVSTGLASSSTISLGFGYCSNYGANSSPVSTVSINPVYADGSSNKLSQTYCLTN